MPDKLTPTSKASLLDLAKTEFPYLADKDIQYSFVPKTDLKDPRMLEFYSPEETQRPANLPLGKVGVENYDPNTKTSDLLADYVSHHAVQNDPKLKPLYDAFASTLDNKVMQERYQYDVAHEGEKRSFEDWAKASGVPAVFRGYTFRQFPEQFNNRFYSPTQKQILNQIRSLVGYK